MYDYVVFDESLWHRIFALKKSFWLHYIVSSRDTVQTNLEPVQNNVQKNSTKMVPRNKRQVIIQKRYN